jgi:hypothetical protein
VRLLLDGLATAESHEPITIHIGLLHGLMHDLDLWREIANEDISKWSFNALVTMAQRMLDEVYPVAVFTGESVGIEAIARVIDERIRTAEHIHITDETIAAAAKAVSDLLQSNSGVSFVVALRGLIHQFEQEGRH